MKTHTITIEVPALNKDEAAYFAELATLSVKRALVDAGRKYDELRIAKVAAKR
jgi:hypothetical protein